MPSVQPFPFLPHSIHCTSCPGLWNIPLSQMCFLPPPLPAGHCEEQKRPWLSSKKPSCLHGDSGEKKAFSTARRGNTFICFFMSWQW